MRAIEAAAVAVERATGQVELASARHRVRGRSPMSTCASTVNRSRCGPGARWSSSISAPIDVEIPGLLTARVVPGVPASETQAKLGAAQEVLAAALAGARVDELAAARTLEQRRRELITARDRLRATSEALADHGPVDELRARLAELQERQAADGALFVLAAGGPADPVAARAELDAAVAANQQAMANCETHRKVSAEAVKRLGERTTRASVLQEKLTAARAELTNIRERLAQQRAVSGDDELSVKAEADGEAARRAAALVAELDDELARSAPEAVAAALDDAMRGADAVHSRHDEVADALREVTTRLKVYGTEGRKGQLDTAETEREHAEAEYVRVQRRARAAQTLRSVMTRHRDATRLRYVDPFRTQVERLGRIVFGDSFEVDIDSGLRICSRTLAGRTVPYDSLSGGAKEQLGIVARLAGAALVAKEDAVPVVIDDALGFTDADRLSKMGGSVRRRRRRRPGHRADVQPAAICRCRCRPPHRVERLDACHRSGRSTSAGV